MYVIKKNFIYALYKKVLDFKGGPIYVITQPILKSMRQAVIS